MTKAYYSSLIFRSSTCQRPRPDLRSVSCTAGSIRAARHRAPARDGEARVVDLTRELELPQSVSGHVACLRDCALVTGPAEGRQTFYSLARRERIELVTAAAKV